MQRGNEPQKGHSYGRDQDGKYTLGAEIEFQILDADSLDLTQMAPVLLASAPPTLLPSVTHELYQSTLEIRSGVCVSATALEDDLRRACSEASELAKKHNCLLHAAGLHPFACAAKQQLTDLQHYRDNMEELQVVGRQFIPQGFHVHVGLQDRNTAVRVGNAIQAYLPLLLAASASSPFFQGIDTGFKSYRTKLYEGMPASGICGYFHDWQHYRVEAKQLIRMGLFKFISELQWDVRLNMKYNTIEIRICDMPSRFSDVMALAACIQALVASLVEHGRDFGPLSHSLLKANKWQASRHGLQGQFSDPARMLITKQMTIVRALHYLLEELEPMSVRLGSRSYFDIFEQVLSRGNGADQQLQIFRQTGDLQQVVKVMHSEFWA